MQIQEKNVGIWLRVSTEDQAQGISPKIHEERARQYADFRGWRVVEIYHLEAVSGKSVMEHPEAQRMLSDVKRGRIQALVFSKLARLARNTKELLEFSDYFQKYGADLVSIQENIDTSSPAGKLLYTIIGALAEWERNEISSRVKASVKTRAKLGKSLGGTAPYGYKWVNKELQIDLDEAPVRKLMYELFLEYKKKLKVAKILNERGYRTRKGSKFSFTTVDRLLRDPIAKGVRRINYTYSPGKHKHAELKDESEWEWVKAPAIISKEMWEEVNDIIKWLDETKKHRTKPRKHLFSGLIKCHCGPTMYFNKQQKKYVCTTCRNKITEDDMEAVFLSQVEGYFFNEEEVRLELQKGQDLIQGKRNEKERLEGEIVKLQQKLSSIMELYQEGQIAKRAFASHYNPVFEQVEQLELTSFKLEGEIGALEVQLLFSDKVVTDAQDIIRGWDKMSENDKRTIIGNILESVILGKDTAEVNLYGPPSLPTTHPNLELGVNSPRNHMDSCWQ